MRNNNRNGATHAGPKTHAHSAFSPVESVAGSIDEDHVEAQASPAISVNLPVDRCRSWHKKLQDSARERVSHENEQASGRAGGRRATGWVRVIIDGDDDDDDDGPSLSPSRTTPILILLNYRSPQT